MPPTFLCFQFQRSTGLWGTTGAAFPASWKGQEDGKCEVQEGSAVSNLLDKSYVTLQKTALQMEPLKILVNVLKDKMLEHFLLGSDFYTNFYLML